MLEFTHMNIYIGHASRFNYKEELYKPIQDLKLNDCNFILPHANSTSPTGLKVGLSIEGMPSFLGPPEMISLRSTEDLSKLVFGQEIFHSTEEPGSNPGINHQIANRITTPHIRALKLKKLLSAFM